MAFQLHMRFTGLCCFVPNPDHTRARVVLVNAMNHVPALILKKVDLKEGPEPDFKFGHADGMYLYRLEGRDLWIDKATGEVEFSGPADVSMCPKDDHSNEESFGWVAQMEKINSPGGANILEECLRPSEVPQELVAGRVELTAGRIFNLDFAADKFGVIRWEFKSSDNDDPILHTQALAEEVQLTYPILPVNSVDSVVLARRDRIYTDKPVDLNNWLELSTTKPSLQVWIANMPWKDIIERDYSVINVPGDKEIKLDPHFIHFYDLINGSKANRIPYATAVAERCKIPLGPNPDNPKCPPVQFSAHPKA